MKSTKTKTFLRLLAGIFMVASLATFFPSPSAHAADPGLKKEGCIGYESIGYKSPFSKTKDLCLGQGQTYQYYQFVVKFKDPVSNATINAKSASGSSIKFVKQDNNTYVSQQGDFDGMGYAAPKSTSSSTCNTKDKIYSVTINVSANNTTDKKDLNLCSYTKVDQSLIYWTADKITTDNGTVSKTGTIRGNLGLVREDPLVPEKWKNGTFDQDGVVSIKLSGKATKSGNNTDTWYTLTAGKLIIPNLDSGTYNLEITYNDKPALQGLGGDAGWTSSDIKLSYKNIVVPPGGEVWIANSTNDKVAYFNTEGKEVDPAKAPESDESPTKCNVEGIGWILCPISNAMAGMTDSLMAGVTAFMKVAPLNLSPNDNPLYTAWSVMRSLANVAFVIVFLIIIFSQLTSAGVSNYGVKKLLPRLIIGAILVNVSYFVCAIAVDISNILGVGLQDLFSSISAGAADTGEKGDNWGSITTSILSGGVITIGAGLAIETLTAGGLWGAVTALVPLLVGALFALIVAFLILLARQALIIMLIVIAPLAFVAFLLPNTESLFKKWQKLFTTLLVLFPMLSIVFGGSMLASVILRASAGATLSGKQEGDDFIALCLYIGSFAVQAIPFFITPLLITLSQGVLSRFAGLVNNKNKGPFDRMRKGGERIAKDAQNRRFANKVNAGGGLNFGARRRARIDRVSSGLESTAKHNANEYINEELGNPNSSLATRMAGGDPVAGAIISAQAIASTEAADLKEALQPLIREIAQVRGSGGDVDTFLKNRATSATHTASERNAAMHQAASLGRDDVIRDLKGNSTVNQAALSEAIGANAGSLLGKAPDIVKGAKGAFDSVRGSQMSDFSAGTAKEHMRRLEQLHTKASAAGATAADRQELDNAVAAFNSSIKDIQGDTTLQAKFGSDTGRAIQTAISDSGTAFQTYAASAAMSGLTSIQSDGKIR